MCPDDSLKWHFILIGHCPVQTQLRPEHPTTQLVLPLSDQGRYRSSERTFPLWTDSGRWGFSAHGPLDSHGWRGQGGKLSRLSGKQRWGQALGGQALVAGLHMHRITFILLRKGNGVCSKSFSPTCLLWKPREVRVRCPAQKQTCATHSHTPSIQPNNLILQTHNPSFVWTAVSKQPWTQRPSQTSPSAEPGEGNMGLPGKLVLR